MPCYQSSGLPSGVSPGGLTSYQTEADCLNACNEGACCETVNGVTTCTVKPQCQCQAAGQVFKGVGTTCESSPCTGACCSPRGVVIDPNAGAQSYVYPSCDETLQSQCQSSGTVFSPQGSPHCTPRPGGVRDCVCDFGICCEFNSQPSGGKYLCSYSGPASQYMITCVSAGGTWVSCADGTGRVGQYGCSPTDPFEFNPLP